METSYVFVQFIADSVIAQGHVKMICMVKSQNLESWGSNMTMYCEKVKEKKNNSFLKVHVEFFFRIKSCQYLMWKKEYIKIYDAILLSKYDLAEKINYAYVLKNGVGRYNIFFFILHKACWILLFVSLKEKKNNSFLKVHVEFFFRIKSCQYLMFYTNCSWTVNSFGEAFAHVRNCLLMKKMVKIRFGRKN
jgi:hypothetical protein